MRQLLLCLSHKGKMGHIFVPECDLAILTETLTGDIARFDYKIDAISLLGNPCQCPNY